MRMPVRIAAVLVALSSPAAAETLKFTYAEAGLSFSYLQSADPTPILTSNFTVEVPITGFESSFPDAATDIYYYNGAYTGGFSTVNLSTYATGAQIYGGTQAAPTFAIGTYALYDMTDQAPGTLSIAALPEPSTWALMLLGVAAMGGALRAAPRHAALRERGPVTRPKAALLGR